MKCGTFADDIGRTQAIRVASQADVLQAERLYRRFMHRDMEHYYLHEFRWPSQQALFGHCLAIGYRSNKSLYGDRLWRDYIHHHNLPYPEITVARSEDAAIWGSGLPPRALTMLGYVLDLQIDTGDGRPQYINWKKGKCPAFLCGDGHSHRLFIIPQHKDAGSVMSLWSPTLRIRPAGIVN